MGETRGAKARQRQCGCMVGSGGSGGVTWSKITDSKATACAYLTCPIPGGTRFKESNTQGQCEVKQQQCSEMLEILNEFEVCKRA